MSDYDAGMKVRREVLGDAAGRWRQAALWTAPLLLAMYGRYWLGKLQVLPAVHALASALLLLVPLAAGIVLLALTRRDWDVAAQVQAQAA